MVRLRTTKNFLLKTNLSSFQAVYIRETGFITPKEVADIEAFENLLSEHRVVVERFVKFRIGNVTDAEDILQEVYLTAYEKLPQLKQESAFRPWLISIAKNKCNDYFRQKANQHHIPIDELTEPAFSDNRHGITAVSAVRDTLERLGSREKQILYLYYWKELPQAEIAEQLGIPLGTVKSRLHTAKRSFRAQYPYPPHTQKGTEQNMKKLPEYLPEYTIEPLAEAPFPVRWEELQGWLIVPKLGERLCWGMYDLPSRRQTEYTEMEVVGKAEVHGIEGVEIVALQHNAADYYRTGKTEQEERRFVAQLTDTHSRYLAESHFENGVRKSYTFLDGDAFLQNWGFGEDNRGNEVNLRPKHILTRQGQTVTGQVKREEVDVVGRYRVTIGGKVFDTICVMLVDAFCDTVATEQFIDRNGRTVLWRRFNRDDWAIDRFGGHPWSEQLPHNERLFINGDTYVHWYDCISDYIL